jgi:hypothetical protein
MKAQTKNLWSCTEGKSGVHIALLLADSAHGCYQFFGGGGFNHVTASAPTKSFFYDFLDSGWRPREQESHN